MADVKISGLPASTVPLAGTEVLPIVQSSTTKKVSIANVTAGRAVSALSFAPTGSALPVNGLFLPATNAVGLATNSEERLRISATGGVSIGNTVDPGATNLSVTGALTLGTALSVGNGGTGLTALNAGYIPFGSTSSALTTDGNFSWDNTNKRLGVGTASPNGKLNAVVPNLSVVGLFANSGLSISTDGGALNNIYQIGFGYGGSGATYASSAIYGLITSSSGYNNSAICFATRSATTDTAPAEVMRIFSSGGVSIGNNTDPGATNLSVTGNITLGSNSGITFSNTSALTNSKLNDYEIGTWTPTATSSVGSITTYTSAGTYTKVGRVVTVTMDFIITTPGTAAGSLLFANLPFSTLSSGARRTGIGVCREDGLTGVFYALYTNANDTTGTINSFTNTAISWAAGSVYACSFSYEANF